MLAPDTTLRPAAETGSNDTSECPSEHPAVHTAFGRPCRWLAPVRPSTAKKNFLYSLSLYIAPLVNTYAKHRADHAEENFDPFFGPSSRWGLLLHGD